MLRKLCTPTIFALVLSFAHILLGCDDSTPTKNEPSPADCPTMRSVGANDAACNAGKGGPMREIPKPQGGTMCIDKTEVTVGQYQAFVASGELPQLPMGDPASARCSTKTNYAASCHNEPCVGNACDVAQTCVDQCDAKAYCAWAGKRLCGAIDGAPLAISEVTTVERNQWMNACAAGERDWPYGPEYQSQACNTSDQAKPCGGPAVTSAYPQCQAPVGPYDQVFDLSGNVSEWVDASQETGTDWPDLRCVIMGGSYVHYWGDVSCAGATLEWPCNAKHPEFGFRCCSL